MNKMSSDSEFSDIGEEAPYPPTSSQPNDRVKKVKKKATRGKDVDWEDDEKLADAKALEESVLFSDIKEKFSLRKNREFAYADVQGYECKFSRRNGYLPCPLKYRVSLF